MFEIATLLSRWSSEYCNVYQGSHALLIGLVAVSIRFYGKGVLRKIIRADDWIILAALLFSIAVTAMPLIALNYDLGLRLVDSDPDNLVHILQVNNLPYYPSAF